MSYSHNLQLAHFFFFFAPIPSPLLPSLLPYRLPHIRNHRHAAEASKSIDNLGSKRLTIIHHNTCNDNVAFA